jgi:hypothetical protein
LPEEQRTVEAEALAEDDPFLEGEEDDDE